MIDLDKVFGAARCESWEDYPTACITCQYGYQEEITLSDGNVYYGCNRDKILDDALALLKPRLLTYADMYATDVGFLQIKDDGGIYPVLLCGGGWDDENCMTLMKRSKKLVRLDGDWLNKNWRVWDRCPTPEDEEATPWKE